LSGEKKNNLMAKAAKKSAKTSPLKNREKEK
jgi:hypothetical protein